MIQILNHCYYSQDNYKMVKILINIGNDIGTQYRSAIFFVKDSHKDEVLKFKEELIAEKVWDQPIVTQVDKIDIFYPAEDYHHNYFNNNKSQGYCQFVIQPKIEKYKKIFEK